MLTHEEMIGLQAEKHELIDAHSFRSREEYVLHLIHSFAYVQASMLAESKTVLDLGCNTGYGSEILFKTAKRVVGVDVSAAAISTAKKLYGHLGIDFRLIDGKQLPFNDNEFDIIISCQVIEHIVDYNAYLNELKRILSPLGIVIFTTPNALLRLDPGMRPWNKFHVREFDHTELKTLLNKHFSAVQILGLFAEEILYLIEKTRLNRAREAARRYQRVWIRRFVERWRVNRARGAARRYQQSDNHYQRWFRSTAKRVMPAYILLRKLRKLLASSSQSSQEINKIFIEKHSERDFFYRTDDLNIALDLLAICSDEPISLKGIKKRLKVA